MSYKRKIGTIDGYTLTELSLILFLTMFVTKPLQKYACFPLLFAGLSFGYATFKGKTFIINNSGKELAGMDENDHEKIKRCRAGENISNVDGIKQNGVVYKIPDGLHVSMTERGPKAHSVMGKIVYSVRGGIQNFPPDESWVPLFNSKY